MGVWASWVSSWVQVWAWARTRQSSRSFRLVCSRASLRVIRYLNLFLLGSAGGNSGQSRVIRPGRSAGVGLYVYYKEAVTWEVLGQDNSCLSPIFLVTQGSRMLAILYK